MNPFVHCCALEASINISIFLKKRQQLSVLSAYSKTHLFSSLKPVVPKKPKRSVPVSSSVDREQSHREPSRVPLSREASDVIVTPTVRKTDVRTETQPNGSEVTTTIVEFTDQVNFIETFF